MGQPAIELQLPQAIVHIEQTVTFPILDTKWIPQTAKFVSMGVHSNKTGALKVFELNEGSLNLVREITQRSGFRCGSFGGSTQRTHLAAADFDGRLQILDIERIDGCIYSVKAHSDGVNCLDSIGGLLDDCGPPEIVTGGRDGLVKVWDSRQNDKPVIKMQPHKTVDSTGCRECWSVAFGNAYNNRERCVLASFDNGDIKLFDLRQLKPIWETKASDGICHLNFHRASEQMDAIVASSVRGSLRVFRADPSNYGQFSCYVRNDAGSPPNPTIWFAKHMPQNSRLFATGTATGSIQLWSHQHSHTKMDLRLLQTIPINALGVNCFDWSPDRFGLAVTGSFDRVVRVIVTTNLH